MKNKTGYYRVSKVKDSRYKEGISYKYRYKENNKTKTLVNSNLLDLRENVIKNGLKWHNYKKNNDSVNKNDVISIYFYDNNKIVNEIEKLKKGLKRLITDIIDIDFNIISVKENEIILKFVDNVNYIDISKIEKELDINILNIEKNIYSFKK